MARVLMVDDDAKNLKLAVTVLAQAGRGMAALAALEMNGDAAQSAVPPLAFAIDA